MNFDVADLGDAPLLRTASSAISKSHASIIRIQKNALQRAIKNDTSASDELAAIGWSYEELRYESEDFLSDTSSHYRDLSSVSALENGIPFVSLFAGLVALISGSRRRDSLMPPRSRLMGYFAAHSGIIVLTGMSLALQAPPVMCRNWS